MNCAVCWEPVIEGAGLVVRTPSGTVIHGDCVWRVAEYETQGKSIRDAVSLVRHDLRAEARRASRA